MEKPEPSSQINFSTQFRQRHQIYRRVEIKGRVLERVRGIFMSYLRQVCGLDPKLMQRSFLVLVWNFLVVVMTIINCSGAGGSVI